MKTIEDISYQLSIGDYTDTRALSNAVSALCDQVSRLQAEVSALKHQLQPTREDQEASCLGTPAEIAAFSTAELDHLDTLVDVYAHSITDSQQVAAILRRQILEHCNDVDDAHRE